MGRKKKVDSSIDTMILTDCINDVNSGNAEPRVYKIGRKYGVHHSYVRRLWDSLSPEKRVSYEEMINGVQEKVLERHADTLDQLNIKMIRCANKALEIWAQRLEKTPHDIADRDLISFMMKVAQGPQDKEQKVAKNNLIFNIIDQSITTEYNEK